MEYTLGVLAIIVNNAPNLVGFILPSVVEAINKDVPSGSERRIVSLLVCLFAAVLLHWNSIAYGTPDAAVGSFILLFAESQTVFRLWFGNSSARTYIQDKVNTSWKDTEVTPVTQ